MSGAFFYRYEWLLIEEVEHRSSVWVSDIIFQEQSVSSPSACFFLPLPLRRFILLIMEEHLQIFSSHDHISKKSVTSYIEGPNNEYINSVTDMLQSSIHRKGAKYSGVVEQEVGKFRLGYEIGWV